MPTTETAQSATKPSGNLFFKENNTNNSYTINFIFCLKIVRPLAQFLLLIKYSKVITKKQQKVTKKLRKF
jgi:hypothetical protein